MNLTLLSPPTLPEQLLPMLANVQDVLCLPIDM
jgi:hypothetical protein